MIPETIGNGGPRFQTTRWSLILKARCDEPEQARDALGDLCALYWQPIYAFIRHQGRSAEQARDLTQEFFCQFLRRKDYEKVDPSKGRFRTYLLKSCVHFLINERRRPSLDRLGPVVSIDAKDAERGYRSEPASELTPVQVFERRWALTVIETALNLLRQRYAGRGQGELLDALLPTLSDEPGRPRYAEIALGLGMTEGAVQVAVHRLRGRFRDVIRDLIAETVAEPGEVESEIHDLFGALRVAGTSLDRRAKVPRRSVGGGGTSSRPEGTCPQ